MKRTKPNATPQYDCCSNDFVTQYVRFFIGYKQLAAYTYQCDILKDTMIIFHQGMMNNVKRNVKPLVEW